MDRVGCAKFRRGAVGPCCFATKKHKPDRFWVSAKFVYRVVGMKHERPDQLRSSREVHKSSARRTQPEAISGISKIGIREKVYESTKLAAVFDTLVHQDVSAEEILRGVTIRSEDVHSPNTRISLGQLIAAYQNAIVLSTHL